MRCLPISTSIHTMSFDILCPQDTPPQYNASAITVPLALYWGGNDWLADPDDVKVLMQKLDDKTLWYNKTIKAWQHLDFIWGLDAAPLVYDDIAKKILDKELEFK